MKRWTPCFCWSSGYGVRCGVRADAAGCSGRMSKRLMAAKPEHPSNRFHWLRIANGYLTHRPPRLSCQVLELPNRMENDQVSWWRPSAFAVQSTLLSTLSTTIRFFSPSPDCKPRFLIKVDHLKRKTLGLVFFFRRLLLLFKAAWSFINKELFWSNSTVAPNSNWTAPKVLLSFLETKTLEIEEFLNLMIWRVKLN